MGKTYERYVVNKDDVRRLYEDVSGMPDVEFYRGYTGSHPGEGSLVDWDSEREYYRFLKPGEWGVNPAYMPEITVSFDEMFNASEQLSEATI